MIKFRTLRHALMVTAATLGGTIVATVADRPAYAQDAVRSYTIPAQNLDGALRAFALQSGRDILYSPALVQGKRSQGVQGQHTEAQALAALLSGTGLRVQRTTSGGYALTAQSAEQAVVAVDGAVSELPEVLVTGSVSQNADIRRTEDDAQPYVVFSGEDIERSGATNLEDFLRTRLPMNSQRGGSNQRGGNNGTITLRGLSAAQTLILVDGRRVPSVAVSGQGGVEQFNVNGIPTSAIERIEVLPATAGGIYGGGAVGGVINIILKRDYTGVDIETTYGNAFETDVGHRAVSITGGLSLDSGQTRVTFSASASRQNELQYSDRDFQRRARELNWLNRPADFTFPIQSLTPNICSAIGASTSCSAGAPNLVLDTGTALNSRFTSVPIGYAGPASDNGAGLVAGAGRFNFNPVDGATSLYSAPKLEAYAFGVRREFGERVEGFLDLGLDRLRATDTTANGTTINLAANHPDNPFQQNIAVSIPFSDSRSIQRRELENIRARAGLIARLPGDWSTALEYGWSSSDNFINGDGFVDFSTAAAYLRSIALRDPNAFPADPVAGGAGTGIQRDGPFETELTNLTLRFSGPIFRLPAGPITLSGYLERREEEAAANITEFIFPSFSQVTWYAPKSQSVDSAYLEMRVPLVTPAFDLPFAHELEVFGALRRDDYETVSGPEGAGVAIPSRAGPFPSYTTSTNRVSSDDYTLGLRFAPVEDIAFRASFGTGFLPPNLGQITSIQTLTDLSFSASTDPLRGNTPLGTAVIQVTGGSPGLRPERSESLSAGLIVTPRFVPSLRVSVDYTRIDKEDEILGFPGNLAGLLQREAEFPGRVVRGPLTPGDAALGYTGGPITSLDLTQLNIGRSRIEAWDFQVDYELATDRFGVFRPYAVATLQTELVRQTLPTDPLRNAVGFDASPHEWRGNVGVNWELGSWSAAWDAQYYDGSKICGVNDTTTTCNAKIQRQGSSDIPSQLYHDIQVRYAFDDTWGPALDGAEIRFGVQNVFNRGPLIRATTAAVGYDLYGDPRMRRFMLTVSRHF